MQWQLERAVEGEPSLDYFFPFEQFQGANINLVTVLTSLASARRRVRREQLRGAAGTRGHANERGHRRGGAELPRAERFLRGSSCS